ncbi:synaptonemal complex protein 2-like isoform X2 [Corythoichthys intestinalis]|uniref:synaptonemal complex protein 2-like isoform X2 n=1 Tax=Corythoichthys intestinalis TaxID=161448 RepID=UPI0025A587C9|nr:synaptonemal complex protein 2-like isoform X2 [Corythoichthys intestinalis]
MLIGHRSWLGTPYRRTRRLEKAIADAFKSRNITALGGFLQKPINEAVKCSAEFLNKLDILINQSLSEKDSNAVSIALTVIYKWGKNLKFPMGTQGITGLIDQGLIQKMVQWFDKCKQLWILHGPQFDQSLSRLSEDFFDVLTMVHKASKDGMFGIQFFLYHIGHLVNDARIFIFIRKKAISTLTIILKNVPASPEREKFFTSLDTSDIMTNLAGQIMQCGDYDMQVSLIEVLFRLTTTDQRQKLSSHWFSMAQVACAFWQIKPLEFEVDCRTFLIFVNGLQGENGRVMSYPCLEVYLDAFKLLKPSDDKLSKFWIDFNLGSQSISFYFSLCDEKSPTSLWDSICISENELQSYTLTEKGTKQILQLRLSEVVMTGSLQGSSITIIFCSTLNILQTVCCIYGHRKYKSTIRKTSVANMTLNIIEEDKSQNCIPESQLSLGVDVKNINNFLGAVETSSQVPANMMLSELTTFSNRSSKGRTHQSNNPDENKRKPFLKMFCPSDRKKCANIAQKKTPVDEIIKCGMTKQTIPLISESVKIEGQGTEQSQEDTFVPGTQLLTERNMAWRNNLSANEIPSTVQKNPLSNHEQFANDAKKQKQPIFASKEKISRSSYDLELYILKEMQAQGKQVDNPIYRERHSLVETSSRKSTSKQETNSNDMRPVEGKMAKSILSYYTTNRQPKENAGSRQEHWIPPSVNSMSLHPANKENARAGDVTKLLSKIPSNSANQRKHVYEFTTDDQFSPEATYNTFIDKSATSCKGFCKSPGHSKTTCTGELAANEKRNGKMQLFGAKDNTNFPDASWLREPNKKATTRAQKQPMTVKEFQAHKSNEITAVPRGVLKPGKRNARLNKARLPKKAISEPGKPSVNKRPRRAATLGKNYEEPYTDESSSELEMPQSTKRNSIIAQPNKSSVTKIHAQKPTSKRSHPDQLASQSCTERSQCSEMSTHLMEMAFSPAFSLPPSSTLKETPVIQQSSLSVASLPLAFKKASAIVTSPHSHFSVSDLNCSFTPESDVSQVSVCLSIQVQQSTIASQAEKTPHSNKEPTFISGPCRKHHTSSRNFEDQKEQRKKCPSRMKPTALFKSYAEKITEGKGLATCSSMMTDHSTIDGGNEEMHLEDLELPNVAMNFSNLSQLLSNKLKNNVKILNMFYKENMRTIQEHIFALHTQLGKHRKLAIVQKVFLNEVHKLKKGRAMLSSIENDLKICLEKQNTFFQSYHKQAIKSIAVLKRTLRDLRLSHKYDEQLFISQMAHLKKDMESVQARLLRTMQRGQWKI